MRVLTAPHHLVFIECPFNRGFTDFSGAERQSTITHRGGVPTPGTRDPRSPVRTFILRKPVSARSSYRQAETSAPAA